MPNESKTEQRERHIQHEMMYCQHYDPQPGSLLNKGTSWCKAEQDTGAVQAATKAAGVPPPWCKPCIDGHELEDATKFCPHWIQRTREMGEAQADKIGEAVNRMTIIGKAIKGWRTWSKTNRVAKAGVIECPICKGRLHLSQAAYNGHVWGKCETAGCANWME